MTTAKDSAPRFCVGLDLGTSNSVVAYAALGDAAEKVKAEGSESRAAAVRVLEVPQLITPGEVAERQLLPSAIYHPDERELAPGDLALPWDRRPTAIAGEAARRLGLDRPDRLVSSAKSWLCHDAVDRRAKILPWGAGPDVPRISPVRAKATLIEHLRSAWDHGIAGRYARSKLAAQDVILCVPASFDETARELTVEAAQEALGLEVGSGLHLLEEPLAALYSWLGAREERWADRLAAGERVLVCDVGGGTTDFSIVKVVANEDAPSGLSLERTAVSDHLLLGGDNMDLALARLVEPRISGRDPDGDDDAESSFTAKQWHELVQSCRIAKEALLAGKRQEATVGVKGSGSKLIGGARSTRLTAEEVRAVVIDGFLPLCKASEKPKRRRTGLAEFGLPFAADPAVTRHLVEFLRRHADADDDRDRAAGKERLLRPDAVLFNGGPFLTAALRTRVIDALVSWFKPRDKSYKPRVLRGERPELAVAVGAAYFGMIRRGGGPRIRSGLARSYYVAVGGPKAKGEANESALCLVPQGLEEGDEVTVERELTALTNQPVSFGLYASTSRGGDVPGDVVDAGDEEFVPMAPLATVLRTGKKKRKESVPVALRARLTEVGTLEMWLASQVSDRRWRLEFGVRGASGEESGGGANGADGEGNGATDLGGIDPARIDAATRRIQGAFAASGFDAVKNLNTIMRQLEDDLGLPRDGWPKGVVRTLWDESIAKISERRTVAREYESRWFNIAGFCLRPGVGAHLDEERVRTCWKVYLNGVTFQRNTPSRIEWLILWRRLSAGLSTGQQEEVMSRLFPQLTGKGPRARLGGQELEEAWRLAASLENTAAARREKLGDRLIEMLFRDEAPRAALWALGRLGARQPVHAPQNATLHAQVATRWLEHLVVAPIDDRRRHELLFAIVQLARRTGDRGRDLPDGPREKALAFLRERDAPPGMLRHVEEVVAYEAAEQKVLLADSLPPGLQLKS